MVLGTPDEFVDLRDTFGCSDCDDEVTGFEHEFGRGSRDGHTAANDCNDGDACLGVNGRFLEGSTGKRGTVLQTQPVDRQAFDLLLQIVEPLGDVGSAHQVSQRAGVIGIKVGDCVERVGIIWSQREKLAAPGEVYEHADPLGVDRGELVTDADPGEHRFLNVAHRSPFVGEEKLFWGGTPAQGTKGFSLLRRPMTVDRAGSPYAIPACRPSGARGPNQPWLQTECWLFNTSVL